MNSLNDNITNHMGEKMKTGCRFCAICDGEKPGGMVDTAILENDRYLAIPSIGALVEGWTLIVPKTHSLSLRHDYCSRSFQEFVSEVSGLVSAAYGPIVAFEHGSNHDGSPTGCGTDHAHLHLVPFTGLDSKCILKSGLEFQSIPRSQIHQVAGEGEYLAYFSDPLNAPDQALVSVLSSPTPQFFRRLIGQQLNLSNEEADYKLTPRIETAIATATTLLATVELSCEHG